MTQALTFNDVTFSPVTHQNTLWIRAAELARALGYAREELVSRLYQRNSDEFTPDMTQLIEIVAEHQNGVPGNLGAGRCRIFSLRGCHLLAMFARTPVAKAFRVWVLDVLDKLNAERSASASEPSPISRRTDPERKQLTAIINTWVGMAPIHYAAARAQVNAHLGVASVDAMTVAQVKEAVQYVQGKIDALPAAPSTPPAIEDRRIPDAMAELRELVTHCGRVRNIVHMECHPGGVSMSLSAQEREAYYAFQGMYQTAVDNMYAATHALDTCLKLRAMYPIRG